MGRCERTGRFIKGNKAATGNKGNINSKWDNKNALKDGHYSRFKPWEIECDGYLFIYLNIRSLVRVDPTQYTLHKDGSVTVLGAAGKYFAMWGIQLNHPADNKESLKVLKAKNLKPLKNVEMDERRDAAIHKNKAEKDD